MSEPDIYTIKLADNEPEQFVKHTDYMKLHYSWKEMFADGIQVLRQERDEMAKLKAEVERLTDALNKLVKTPPEATGGVRVKVDFWTQYGSRLPSSYETFWENADKEGKQS